jgi:AraC-like DNA-binding protein
MLFSEIKPFGRYFRYLKITENSTFGTTLPIDCRLFYVKKGVGKIEVNNEVLTLPTGSLLYINSFVPYTILKSDVRYLAVNFDFTFNFSHLISPIPPIPIEKKQEYAPLEQITFEDATCFNKYVFIENAFKVFDIFENAEEDFTKKAPFYIMKNSAQITTILIELYRKNEFRQTGESTFNAEEISEYIKEHLSEDISNKVLADHFHFHKNYLSSEFARHFGKPIHAYILEMRIMKAIALLEAGRSSITDIAAKVGFSDSNYFTRYFKKITGTTPKAYLQRKNIGL